MFQGSLLPGSINPGRQPFTCKAWTGLCVVLHAEQTDVAVPLEQRVQRLTRLRCLNRHGSGGQKVWV